MRAFLYGVAGAVVAGVVAGLIYLAYDTHRMAKRGDAAATFLETQIRQAQQTR